MSNLAFQVLSATALLAFAVALMLAWKRRDIAPLAAVNLGASAIVVFHLVSRLVFSVLDSTQMALLAFALLAGATSLAEFLGTRMPRVLIALQFGAFALAVIAAVLIAFTFRITRLM